MVCMGVIWPPDLGLTVECPPILVPGAPAMFIGDCPESRAISTRTAFAGINELVLGKLWSSVGWSRSNVSLTYLWKGGSTGREAQWESVLKSELEDPRFRPNVAVACCDAALVALCGVQGITKYRGSILPSTLVPGLKVIPMVPPRYIIQGNFGEFYIAQHDMQRIKEQSAFPEIRHTPWTPITQPSFDMVMSCIKAIRSDELWSLDIETRADSLTCVGIGFGSSALCIPIQTTTGPYFTAAQELAVWQTLGSLMRRNPNLIGQNLTFDLEWLLGYGVLPSGIHLDTMLGFALLYPEFPKGLDTIASIYTEAPYYKDDGKTWGWAQPDARLWVYNAKDCFYTLQAAIALEKEIRSQGKWAYVSEYINREVFAALEMQRTRLKRSDKNNDRLTQITEQEVEATWVFREMLSGKSVNVNSPKQVKDFLYGMKRLVPIIIKGKASVDQNALKKLRTRYPSCQELELIIKERQLRKKLGSYLKIPIDPDGFLGCSWNVAGTETGRWSSGKSAHRRGLNTQTVPKLLRFAYEASPERVFIQPDLSQAEARVVAYLARCAPLIKLFNDPKRSVHMENGIAIFGYAPEKDSKDYVLAKQCLHAANYMMQAERFAVETGITLVRAKEILAAYHATYPELTDWHARTRETIRLLGKLITPLGRERIFYHARAEILLTGSLSNESWRNAVAYIPQATVPDVLNQGMLQTWQELDYMWLHHQGHDSCLVSVPYDKLGECAGRLATNLTRPIPMGDTTLTIPVEVAYGKYWHPMRAWKGEQDFTTVAQEYYDYVEGLMTHEYIVRNLA